MSPCSTPVLGAAAVLASSALWHGLVEGTLSVDVALTRYLVAVAVAWAALSALVLLVGAPPKALAAPAVAAAEGPSPDGGATPLPASP